MRRRDGEVKLPGTTVAFRAGIARLPKADLICRAAELLDAGGGQAADGLGHSAPRALLPEHVTL
jgi:hypothetical protein